MVRTLNEAGTAGTTSFTAGGRGMMVVVVVVHKVCSRSMCMDVYGNVACMTLSVFPSGKRVSVTRFPVTLDLLMS
jgi:hypothetical protein